MRIDRHQVFLAGIFAAGAVLRLANLGSASLWHDEAHTWLVTRLPFELLLEALLLNGVHPPLYFAAVKLTTSVFGDGEAALRAISAAADLISMVILARLGRRLAGKVGQATILLFWAFHPMAIWYAREARPYALATALTITLLWLFIEFIQESNLRIGFFAVITIAVGSLTHYFFFIPAVALIGVRLWAIKSRPDLFRRWTLLSMAGFLPLAGWQLLFFSQSAPSLGIGWIQRPPLVAPLLTLWNLFSGFGGRTSPATLAFGLTALVLITAGLLHFNSILQVRRLFLIAVPCSLAAIWVLSQRRPLYMDRYFIVLLPIFAVTAAVGAQGLYERLIRARELPARQTAAAIPWVAAVLLGVWAGSQVHRNPTYAREDWRDLIAYLEAANQPESPVFLQDPETIMLLAYYAEQDLPVESELIIEACGETCWWILRQPYTYTHAFTSSVTDPAAPWGPEVPESCRLQDRWVNSPGIALWRLGCG